MPMILLNIVAKYQRDEVVICFWIGSFCRSNVGLLLSGGLRHFDELIETKINSKCGFLDDETVSIFMFC
jgi:hypothetical protein